MKRVVMIIIAAMMITPHTFAAVFSDTAGHWAEGTIDTLSYMGIVNGMTDTEFDPDGAVTRAQYLKMIMEATGVKTAEYRPGECLEAKSADWYAPYLQGALDSGLIPHSMITGFKESVDYLVDEYGKATESRVVYAGAFNGDLPISREEMAVLTEYCYQYTRTVLTNKSVNNISTKPFTDQGIISSWAENSVILAAAHGFIEGMDDGSFRPGDSATRAQAATIILRVIK